MLFKSSETNSIPKPLKCCPIRLLSDIRRTEYVCSDSTIISTYAIVLQLQYIYVISRFTPHCVTKNTLQSKLYTYILYINDEVELVNKDDTNDRDDKESGRQWWRRWWWWCVTMMITMIVNQLTSFSKLTTAMHTFKLHTFFYVEGITHAPAKFS